MGFVKIVSDAIITRRLTDRRRRWFLNCQLGDRPGSVAAGISHDPITGLNTSPGRQDGASV